MGGSAMKEFRLGEMASQTPYHYTMSGLDDVYLTSGYDTVDEDGEEGIVIHDLDGLHAAIGLFLAESKKALNGKEIRFLRHEMDLTQAHLGELLSVSDQTVARWEKGETTVDGPAELLLRAFYLGHANENVDIRKLAEDLRAIDAPASEKQIFAATGHGWELLAA
jgi:putative transcriptional regulator